MVFPWFSHGFPTVFPWFPWENPARHHRGRGDPLGDRRPLRGRRVDGHHRGAPPAELHQEHLQRGLRRLGCTGLQAVIGFEDLCRHHDGFYGGFMGFYGGLMGFYGGFYGILWDFMVV